MIIWAQDFPKTVKMISIIVIFVVQIHQYSKIICHKFHCFFQFSVITGFIIKFTKKSQPLLVGLHSVQPSLRPCRSCNAFRIVKIIIELLRYNPYTFCPEEQLVGNENVFMQLPLRKPDIRKKRFRNELAACCHAQVIVFRVGTTGFFAVHCAIRKGLVLHRSSHWEKSAYRDLRIIFPHPMRQRL